MFRFILLSVYSLCIYPTTSTSFLSTPRNLQFWHLSDSTLVKIFWSPPEEPNGKITGYDILYTDNNLLSDRKWKREKVIGEKTTIILTKLIPHSKYFLKIKARFDERELGPPSDVIEFMTKNSSPHTHTSSSTAKILKVIPGKESSEVKITWQKPQQPKGKIKRYEIYYTSHEITQYVEWDVEIIEDIKDIEYIEHVVDINDVKQIRKSIFGLLPNTNYKFIIIVKTSEDNVGSISSVFEYQAQPLIKKQENLFWPGVYKLCALICCLILIVSIYLSRSSIKSKIFGEQHKTERKKTQKNNGNTTREDSKSGKNDSFDRENENRESDESDEGDEEDQTISSLSRNVEMCRRRLKEAQELISINDKDMKALIKKVRCLLLLGEISSAIISLEAIKQLNLSKDFYDSNMEKLMRLKDLVEQAENYFKLKNYSSALYQIEKAISISRVSVKFYLRKAEFLAMLGKHSEAQIITYNILEFDELNIEALYLSGLSLYYQDEIHQSFQHFQTLFRLCSDHSKANIVYQKAKILLLKKQQGNQAFNQGKFQSACDIYSSALLIDPLNKIINGKLYFNRCLARAKLNQLDQALDDCNEALNLDEYYMKARHKRAKLLIAKGMYEEAVREYQWIYSADPSGVNKKFLEAAKMKFKISKKKNYYKIIGVGTTAGTEQINKAYRQLALKHHPDRYPNASQNKKKEQEKIMKDINEAYDVLKDPMKRMIYDS